MKKMTKKVLSMVLMLGLILSIFSPGVAMAAGDGSIKVDNPKSGETYTLYRVFDLTLSPDEEITNQNSANATYQYTLANSNLEQLITNNYPKLNAKIKSNRKMVINAEPLNDGTINPYDFSNWLSGLDTSNFVQEGSAIEANTAGDNVSWNTLPLGYYMVKSSLGTLVSLNTTDKNVTIHEKNPDSENIKLSKSVKGGVNGTGTAHDSNTNDGFVEKTYANIGEELEYKITFNVHAYANKEYVLEDILPAGMSLVDTPSVKLGTDSMTTDTTGTDETKKYSYAKDGQKLTFTFSEDTIQAIAATLRTEETNIENNTSKAVTDVKTITITYKAALNNSAEMSNHDGINNNKNTVTLTYDKDVQPALTLDASVDVRTTDFQINKFAEGKEYLEGATFKIYDASTGGNEIKVTKDGETNTYNVNPAETNDVSITSANNENVTIKGLKPGTYWIEETAAPEGYNKIQDRMELIISEDATSTPATKIKYTVTIEGNKAELTDNTVKIENQKGAELPETGGMGRTMLYVIGGTIFVASLVLLITKKRMDNTESNK